MAPTHRNKNSQMAQKSGLVSLGEEKCLCHQGRESVILCSFQKRGHTFSYWFYFLFGSKILWEETVNIPGDKPRCWKICVRAFLNPIFFPEISWQVSLGALHHQGHDHMGTLEEGVSWQPMTNRHTSWVPDMCLESASSPVPQLGGSSRRFLGICLQGTSRPCVKVMFPICSCLYTEVRKGVLPF